MYLKLGFNIVLLRGKKSNCIKIKYVCFSAGPQHLQHGYQGN